jgi:hypothetical protein
MAIGVFETINSPNKISFIGYAGDAGANGERCRDLNVGKDTGNPDTMENYNPSEPMVNGTPSLCKLKNAVDVLYDVKGPSGRGSEPASALVACSDGQLFNKGSLETPNIAIGINGGNQHQKLAVDVVLSLTNANFKMNQGFSISETSPVKNQDGSFLARFNNATTASAFQNIADVLLRNLKNNSNPQLQNNRMSRQNKDQLEKPYRPDRKKFSEK